MDATLDAPPLSRPVETPVSRASAPYSLIGMLLILLIGIVLRVVPSAAFVGVGFDEALYRTYVLMFDSKGLAQYPAITEEFLQDQRNPESITKLPPTRFVYIFSGWAWKRVFHGDAPPENLQSRGGIARDPALVSLHRVSCLFSILTLVLAGVAAWRMFDPRIALGALALLAFSPLQIHMSQHALIDGFFAFWALLALWLLWENLRAPNHPGWLSAYGATLGVMVMTKENSFFVFCALMALVLVNRWAKFGKATPRLLLVSVLGPAAGVGVLVALAGGMGAFTEVYTLLVTKAQNLEYAIRTGDGPWYRYVADLLLMSPFILLLAIGGMYRLLPTSRSYLYLLLFIAGSYLIMCNVRYGMNLRYATIWEFPLRVFAFGQLCWLTRSLGSRQPMALLIAVALLCAYDLRQYLIFFADGKLYEVVPAEMLRALKILK